MEKVVGIDYCPKESKWTIRVDDAECGIYTNLVDACIALENRLRLEAKRYKKEKENKN